MTKLITHRSVNTTFKVNPRSGMVGTLGRAFKVQNITQQVGELFEILARQMFEDRTVFAYKAQFSLVNLTNLVQNSSIGYSITPPKSVLGMNPGLVFTFALTPTPYQKKLPTIKNNTGNYDGQERVTYWSDKATGGFSYLTISIDKNVLRKLKLSFNTEPELTYIYNTVGILTKSFVNQNNWYNINGAHFQRDINLSESALWTKFFQKPLRTMIIEEKLTNWIYCLDFWRLCPNLLTPNFIDIEDFGLYYILYLHEQVFVNRSTIYQSVYARAGGLQDFIAQGIQDFNQALGNPVMDITDQCYAVVHLLESVIEPGGFGIAVDRDEARKRIDSFSRQFNDDQQLSTEFYTYMTDSSVAYRTLMEGANLTAFAKVLERMI